VIGFSGSGQGCRIIATSSPSRGEASPQVEEKREENKVEEQPFRAVMEVQIQLGFKAVSE
jgi:hypothetical protein